MRVRVSGYVRVCACVSTRLAPRHSWLCCVCVCVRVCVCVCPMGVLPSDRMSLIILTSNDLVCVRVCV